MSKKDPFAWIRCPLTEARLDRCGLSWLFEPAVPFGGIDVVAGRHNMSRETTAIDEELALKYALRMQAGHPFKVSTLFLLNDGVFANGVSHGNHRLKGYEIFHNSDTRVLKKCLIGAYVIQSSHNDDVEQYERLANCDEGRPQSQEYSMRNAIWLHQHRGMSLIAAERETGVKSAEISKHITANVERLNLEKMGVETYALTPSHLVRIASLKHDSHKKHVATIANEAQMPKEELSKMVTVVRKMPTEAKGNAYIHDQYNRTRRERVGPTNGKEPVMQRRRRLFLKGVRQFEDLWLRGADGKAISSLADVGIAPQDRQVRQELASRFTEIIALMRKAARLPK